MLFTVWFFFFFSSMVHSKNICSSVSWASLSFILYRCDWFIHLKHNLIHLFLFVIPCWFNFLKKKKKWLGSNSQNCTKSLTQRSERALRLCSVPLGDLIPTHLLWTTNSMFVTYCFWFVLGFLLLGRVAKVNRYGIFPYSYHFTYTFLPYLTIYFENSIHRYTFSLSNFHCDFI